MLTWPRLLAAIRAAEGDAEDPIRDWTLTNADLIALAAADPDLLAEGRCDPEELPDLDAGAGPTALDVIAAVVRTRLRQALREPAMPVAAAPPGPAPAPRAAPLYTMAVVPDYGEKDFRRHQYGAWYISHPDEAQLAPECLQTLFDQGRAAGEIDLTDWEAMADFAVYLEAQGYTVQQTASEGYVVIITAANGADTEDGADRNPALAEAPNA